jgi:glucuronate isomerase
MSVLLFNEKQNELLLMNHEEQPIVTPHMHNYATQMLTT